MKRKIGMVCMVLGGLLLLSSLALMLYNRQEDNRAGEAAADMLIQIRAAIDNSEQLRQEPEQTQTGETTPEIQEDPQAMPVQAGEYPYLGYLSIPALELELPVLQQWSEAGAQMAPCRHMGSVETEDLVIAGHNYSWHFGGLSQLLAGDLIAFTQMDGTVTGYQVAEVRTVEGTDVESIEDRRYSLILYTCTYGGRDRVLVCCTTVK